MPRFVERRIMLGKAEYRLVRVTCGKKNCSKCPHGPYWYATGISDSGKRWIKYLGRNTPAAVIAAEKASDKEGFGR